MKRGFTLIELLVVISIIAILVASATTSWRNAQMKARDGKRKADIKALQQALENYFQTNGRYPTTGLLQSGSEEQYHTLSGGASAWIPQLVSQFISTLPLDPVNSATYRYWYCTPASHLKYVLSARVENTNDPDIRSVPSTDCTTIGGQNFYVTNP